MSDTDLELLARYARQNAEDAFAELVRRHIGLVYSGALRQVGSPQLAEEVAQCVFTDLARNASRLKPNTLLTAWLYQVTRRTAIDVVRRESRRQRREQVAAEMNTMNTAAADWTRISPLLDEAMDALDPTDRDAVLLRYFENKSLREVGQTLGTSDDTAQKRVSRAVDRLREFFAKHGVAVGAGGLATLVSANAIQAAPAGLAASISTAALAAAASGTGAFLGLLKVITMTKLQAAVIGTLVVGGTATSLVLHHQATVENLSLRRQIEQLTADNEGLSSQVAQLKIAPASLPPAPKVTAARATNSPAASPPYERLKEFIVSHHELPREKIEAYLRQNNRNVESLLAAFRVSQDSAYLREAATNSPNDPAVQFAVIASRAFPDEQRKWIDAFKASSPENALSWYFSALDYFKSKQSDRAIQELTEATQRQLYGEYATQTTQAAEEMYGLAGWPALAAKAWAPGTAPLSYLTTLKELANETVKTQQHYVSAGDAASAISMATMGMVLGNQLRRAYGPMDQLVGIAIEKKILGQLDQAANYDFLGRPVSDALSELDRHKDGIRQVLEARDRILPTLNEAEMAYYFERQKLYGEAYALQWLQSKHRQP